MEVSVETPGGLQRRLKIEIPAERVEKAVEEKIRRVGKHAKIPGFRPGKIPLKVLYQRYGDSARNEVAGELVQQAYPEALEQVDLKPAGRPEVELDDYTPGQAMQFTATFDVYPDIELQGLDGLKIERPVAEVADADVDSTIDKLREQNKTFESVERESRDGDQVVIDYVGRIDGEAFEGGTGNDIEVTLGEGRFLPDLERALVGRKPGENFTTDVTFPDDYGAEDLAGKTASFEVTLKTVNEARLPDIDAAFLQQFGVEEDGGEAELRNKIRTSLEGEVANAAENRVKTQVMDALHAANPIEVPNSMVAQEIERMRQEALARMPEQFRQDADKARELLPDEQLRETAERRVALGLLIAQVISERGIELDADRVSAKLDELAGGYEQSEQVKQYYRSNPQMMQGIEAMVMEGQVVDNLLENAKVKDKSVSVDELMNSDQAQG